jgi:shikimate 5-dehydrogenase
MLVNQGVISVQFWTGVEPEAEVMRNALRKALGL